MNLCGKELLAFKTWPFQVAFLRGTTADSMGNISSEQEVQIRKRMPNKCRLFLEKHWRLLLQLTILAARLSARY